MHRGDTLILFLKNEASQATPLSSARSARGHDHASATGASADPCAGGPMTPPTTTNLHFFMDW
jgi:hypothetical protein